MEAVEATDLMGLYAITPDWVDTARLLAVTRDILDGGCRLFQYRNKSADTVLRVAQAQALRALTREYGARLIVNDDPSLALAVEADGVHLGAQDADLASARALLGPTACLGASCYQSLPLARAAVAAGANYVAFGSVYPSPSKPQAGRATLALLVEAVRALPVPVAAIGGITPDNAHSVIETGVHLVAVISALYDAPNPAWTAARFTASFANRSWLREPSHQDERALMAMDGSLTPNPFPHGGGERRESAHADVHHNGKELHDLSQ